MIACSTLNKRSAAALPWCRLTWPGDLSWMLAESDNLKIYTGLFSPLLHYRESVLNYILLHTMWYHYNPLVIIARAHHSLEENLVDGSLELVDGTHQETYIDTKRVQRFSCWSCLCDVYWTAFSAHSCAYIRCLGLWQMKFMIHQ